MEFFWPTPPDFPATVYKRLVEAHDTSIRVANSSSNENYHTYTHKHTLIRTQKRPHRGRVENPLAKGRGSHVREELLLTFAYRIRTTTVTLSTTAVLMRFLGQRSDASAAVLFQNTLTRGQTVETGQAIRSTTSVLHHVVFRCV